MRCEQARMLLTALAHDRLDPATTNELHTHLAACAFCREALSDLLDDFDENDSGTFQTTRSADILHTPEEVIDAARASAAPDARQPEMDFAMTEYDRHVPQSDTADHQDPQDAGEYPRSAYDPADQPRLAKAGIMQNKMLVTGGATLLAVGIFIAILILGPKTSDPRKPVAMPDGTTAPLSINLQDAAPGSSQSPIGAVENGKATRVKDGKVTEFFWGRINQLPQGEFDVERPAARMHLEPGKKVLQIQALHGMLAAPNNQPRSGHFRDRVVVTYFVLNEKVTGRRNVNLSNDSPDIAFRLYMDTVNFDVEVGLLESDGTVFLTSPSATYEGVGLQLNYNEKDGLIQRLEIMRDGTMRIKPDAMAIRDTDRQQRTNAEENLAPDEALLPSAQKDANPRRRNRQARADGQSTRALQFYNAQFRDQVQIQHAGSLIQNIDEMNVKFALDPDHVDNMMDNPAAPSPAGGNTNPPTRREGRDTQSLFRRGIQVVPAMVTYASPDEGLRVVPVQSRSRQPDEAIRGMSSSNTVPPPPPVRSITPVGADDVLIRWRGSMIVTPLEQVPEHLNGADDHIIELRGNPVRITTKDKEDITAAHVAYISNPETFILDSNDKHRVVINSTALGRFTGTKLSMSPQSGIGLMEGAGSLFIKADSRLASRFAGKTQNRNPDADAADQDIEVQWIEQVDLMFYPKAQSAGGETATSDMLGSLRTAQFRGDVSVRSLQMELYSQLLEIELGEPVADKQAVNQIHASERVRVWARGEKPEEELAISSDELDIEMKTRADGDPYPHIMLASGNVRAEQPGQGIIHSHLLRVTLANPDDTADESSAAEPAGADTDLAAPTQPSGNQFHDNAVQQMLAEGQVHAQILGKTAADEARVFAERLLVDKTNDTVQLHGTENEPARVMRQDGMLAAAHITMHESAQSVTAKSPGQMQFLLANDNDEATLEQQQQRQGADLFIPDPSRLVTITWNESMHFDDEAGKAFFEGDVTINSRNGLDTTFVSSEKLHMYFVEVETSADPSTSQSREESASLMGQLGGGDRQVRLVKIDDNAIFLSEEWADEPGKTLLTRLRLEGPAIHITNEKDVQTIAVPGAGRMLWQDMTRNTKPVNNTNNERNEKFHFTGQGATLFTWQDQMLIDALKNDMTMMRTVRMIHRPLDKQELLQLDCDHLTADLAPTGGFTGWIDQSAAKPDIQAVRAAGSVAIQTNRYLILTDHMIYTGQSDVVELIAAEGKRVEVSDNTQPTPMTAQAFKWNRTADRFTIYRPAPGRAQAPADMKLE